MAIELPSEVAQFLNFIGVPWININEDKVREFATHVRQFGSDVASAHGDAAATLTELGSGYEGAAYEALMNMWRSKSTSHINELVDGCSVLATALDVGADFIEGQKVACIGELIGMAAAFVADQAAAVATFGLAEAGLALIEEGAEKLMEFAVQQIEQYLIGEIADAALQPLIGKIETLVEGLVFGNGSGGSAGPRYAVDLAHVSTHADVMKGHAETIRGHVSTFSSNLSSLDFNS